MQVVSVIVHEIMILFIADGCMQPDRSVDMQASELIVPSEGARRMSHVLLRLETMMEPECMYLT